MEPEILVETASIKKWIRTKNDENDFIESFVFLKLKEAICVIQLILHCQHQINSSFQIQPRIDWITWRTCSYKLCIEKVGSRIRFHSQCQTITSKSSLREKSREQSSRSMKLWLRVSKAFHHCISPIFSQTMAARRMRASKKR